MSRTSKIQDLGAIQELLLVNLIQLDTLKQLLIERKVVSEKRFLFKLKEVRSQYRQRKGDA